MAATYTTNYNLKKPAQGDNYNVDDFNDNADTIDTALVEVKQITDTATSTKYVFGIENGILFIEEVSD